MQTGTADFSSGSATPAEKILKLNDLLDGSSDVVSIENYKFVASYNWVKVNEPTILVPRAPPLWSAPKLPVKLSMTSARQRFKDNKDRVITSRWSPLFATLRVMQPTYSLFPIFLVVERNTLRKLFDFACGRSGQDWRIVAEVVNQTLFLTRWEQDKLTFATGSGEPGYGPSFEDKFLKIEDDIHGSCAHHRIVEYNIGGMKWLVRFEAGGYLGNDSKLESVHANNAADIDDACHIMESLAVETQAEAEPEILEGVKVIRKGHLVPCDSIMEAKSRSIHFKSNMRPVTPQCWFSQTMHLFIGREVKGTIIKVEEKDMATTFSIWERENQKHLRMLVDVVKKIERKVRDKGSHFVVQAKTLAPRALHFLKADIRDAPNLSDELRERHWD